MSYSKELEGRELIRLWTWIHLGGLDQPALLGLECNTVQHVHICQLYTAMNMGEINESQVFLEKLNDLATTHGVSISYCYLTQQASGTSIDVPGSECKFALWLTSNRVLILELLGAHGNDGCASQNVMGGNMPQKLSSSSFDHLYMNLKLNTTLYFNQAATPEQYFILGTDKFIPIGTITQMKPTPVSNATVRLTARSNIVGLVSNH
ncbi:hypothetical protein COCC4DRAFT_26616 [Bipolaris maydis ATCC 48331]|uniref:Uncharacterized protein n=2 Tax=Cochliobolus heterostrophus TaxID=5016 RepID=M2U809_COCH5|nr:uncharacterized protein COCC4DRAFT_26616 [Bipolaris maydis ATCC 48331]EMD94674.1 hypothetical protein COCHEDRAFT_1027230 [Bipolaris maydis C5]ENI01614.1 hypothetical protein COCC4DRAFT_26616 [Bipolaris maydis ATCC 48331]KAJ6215149.1 hypothetical protein PSV09DRAFT_1027230 [Bipolaris maydis]